MKPRAHWKLLATCAALAGVTAAWLLARDGGTFVRATAITPAASDRSPYLVIDNRGGAPVVADTFIDASGGTAHAFVVDDSAVAVSAPFPIEVFGGSDTELTVYDNGYLAVGSSLAGLNANRALPFASLGDGAIVAPLWDDLYPKASSRVFTLETGTAPNRAFVVEWSDMAHFDDRTASYQFEVVFFEAKPGEVLLQYGTMTDGSGSFADGRSATVGLQAPLAAGHVTLGVNAMGTLASSLSIDFDRDSDRDGLSDAAEDPNRNGVLEAGETDPADYDTDDGGAGDGAEVLISSTDPRAAGDDVTTDGDGDGVPDADETIVGTNPAVADTDGDGLDDDEGIVFGTDPLNPDTDGDMLSDFDEVNLDGDPSNYTAGTDLDPNDPDTDGGGESDSSELIGGTDPHDGGDDTGPSLRPPAQITDLNSQVDSVSTSIDDDGNVHVVTGTPESSRYEYGMMDATGFNTIDSTEFDSVTGGEPRHVHVFALGGGRVAMVWNVGPTGGGGIEYRLIDTSLDPLDGGTCNTSVNPNSPPTVGDGVTLIERVAIANPGGGAVGYSHLDAALGDDGTIHLVFTYPRRRVDQGHMVVFYAKLKASSGTVLVPPVAVYDVTQPERGSEQPLPGYGVHVRQAQSVIPATDGGAHILTAPFTQWPGTGAHADLWYMRVDASGAVVASPRRVASDVDGCFALHTGVAEDGRLTLFHTVGTSRKRAGDIVATELSPTLAALAPSVVDGASSGFEASLRQPRAAGGRDGIRLVGSFDTSFNGAVRIAPVDANADPIAPPFTVDAISSASTHSRRGMKVGVAASPSGDRFGLAWVDDDDGAVYSAAIDLGGRGLGVRGMTLATAASGGTARVTDGSSLRGGAAAFTAGDLSADGIALIRAGTGPAPWPGPRVGGVMRVELAGGAALAASADYQVRLPVPASFGGNTANLTIYQAAAGGAWTALTTAVDTTTTPVTLTADATAIGDFAAFDTNPTVAFASTPPATGRVGQLYSYTPTVSASATPSFSLVTAPAAMTVDIGTGALAWTPAAADVGAHSVTLRASVASATADQMFTITVSNDVNTAPVITSSPPVVVNAGDTYSYTPTVVDPDTAQTLTFALYTAPAGMTIDSATGEVTWPTLASDIGFNPVSIGVSDGLELGLQAFNISVVGEDSPPANLPPTFVSSPTVTAAAGVAYAYTAVATDPDGDTVSYGLSLAPDGMTIDGASGAVSWTPSASGPDRVQVVISATDGDHAVAQSYIIDVSGTDHEEPSVGCCSSGEDGPIGALVLALLCIAALLPRGFESWGKQ